MPFRKSNLNMVLYFLVQNQEIDKFQIFKHFPSAFDQNYLNDDAIFKILTDSNRTFTSPFTCSINSIFFTSFIIVSATSFIDKPDSSRDLIIFMMSFKCSFENINAAVPNRSKKFLLNSTICCWHWWCWSW